MATRCDICGKGPITARRIIRRGAAKRRGGAGQKITGSTLRRQYPNVQTVRIVVNGTPRKLTVCTSCLKAGKVERLRMGAKV